MCRTISVVMTVVLSLCLAAVSIADDAQDEKDAKKVLDGHAIRVLSSGVAIRDESKLSQAHRNTRKLKKAMLAANKISAAVRKEAEATKGNLIRLRQQSVQFNVSIGESESK